MSPEGAVGMTQTRVLEWLELSDTSLENQGSRADPNVDGQPRLVRLGSTLLFMAGIGYLLVCMGSLFILNDAVPVTGADLAHASWLSFTMSMFTLTLFRVYVGGFLVLIGLTALVIRSNLLLWGLCWLLAFVFIFQVDRGDILRKAVLNDTAVIGCYTYEAQECLAMLGIDAPDAPRMYSEPTGNRGAPLYTEWYDSSRPEIPMTDLRVNPLFVIALAPFDLLGADDLNAKLEGQRQAVDALRAQHGLEPVKWSLE